MCAGEAGFEEAGALAQARTVFILRLAKRAFPAARAQLHWCVPLPALVHPRMADRLLPQLAPPALPVAHGRGTGTVAAAYPVIFPWGMKGSGGIVFRTGGKRARRVGVQVVGPRFRKEASGALEIGHKGLPDWNWA